MLPPRWVETADEIDGDIMELRRKIDLLDAAHNKRLMVSFDDDRESSQDREIDILTHEVTNLFKSCEAKLRRIFNRSMLPKSQQQSGAGLSSELNVRLNKQRALATRVQELSQTFRQSQKRYMTRLKGQKEGAASAGGALGLNLGAEASPSEVDLGFSDEQVRVERRDREKEEDRCQRMNG